MAKHGGEAQEGEACYPAHPLLTELRGQHAMIAIVNVTYPHDCRNSPLAQNQLAADQRRALSFDTVLRDLGGDIPRWIETYATNASEERVCVLVRMREKTGATIA